MRGMLAGALALIALHSVVAYKGPSARLAQLAGPNGLAVTIVRRFLDPTIPAIGGTPSPSSSGATSTGPSITQLDHTASAKATYPPPNAI